MLQKELGVNAELEVGSPGSCVGLVDGEPVIAKNMLGFPDEADIVAAVRGKLQKSA